jgi:hypothetical protein
MTRRWRWLLPLVLLSPLTTAHAAARWKEAGFEPP